jgi:hypothetical protein
MADGTAPSKLTAMSEAMARSGVTYLWTAALEAAVSAVHAGWDAGTLSPEAGSSELKRVKSERDWLLDFDWRSVDGWLISSPVHSGHP